MRVSFYKLLDQSLVGVHYAERGPHMVRLDIPLVPYVSPCFQFARFQALIDRYGDQAVLTTARFRQEREAWIAAAFLMGYGELTERFWWLAAPGSPPDIIAISPRQEAHGWVADGLHLAILEYEHHAPVARVVGAIERKLQHTAYPPDYRLVCYAHHLHGEAFTTRDVAAQLRALRLGTAEVWLVGSIAGEYAEDYIVSRAHPTPREHRFSSLQHCAETPQIKILNAGEGSTEDLESSFLTTDLP